MLDLEELKQALEHDAARRAPALALPDYAAARRLMLDAVLAIECASLMLATQPKEVVSALGKVDEARALLGKAEAALLPRAADSEALR